MDYNVYIELVYLLITNHATKCLLIFTFHVAVTFYITKYIQELFEMSKVSSFYNGLWPSIYENQMYHVKKLIYARYLL